MAHPVVFRRPRVAILGSGDEIVDIDQAEEIRSGRKVASSNTHTLIALVTQAGGIPVNLGIARDTRESMREYLERARDCDLIVTTAGISVGEHDHVLSTLQHMGMELRFWKLRMRPGAPVGFGVLPAGQPASPPGLPWIGLPGNPVSTMVTFELFGRPAIFKMLGKSGWQRPVLRAITRDRVVNTDARRFYARCIVTKGDDGRWYADLTGPQGSGILTSMSAANALTIIPEDQPAAEPGDEIDVMMIDWEQPI